MTDDAEIKRGKAEPKMRTMLDVLEENRKLRGRLLAAERTLADRDMRIKEYVMIIASLQSNLTTVFEQREAWTKRAADCRGVVAAALNWRGTYGVPNDEIDEQLLEALDEIDTAEFRFVEACGDRGFAGPSHCVLPKGHEGAHKYGESKQEKENPL